MTGKERAIAVMNGETTDTLPFMPITMLFAASLVGVSYRRYATEAAAMVSGQMAVADRFGAAQVSVISDPGVEAHDLGAVVGFPEDAPPYIDEESSLLVDKSKLSGLSVPAPASGKRMSNRVEAVRLLKEKAGNDLLVEGWVEGPCAEASDLRGINRLMMDFFDDEDFVGDLMDFVTELEIGFALAQLDAGADIIGIGDAASSLIGPEFYNRFCVPRTKRYVDAIHGAGGLVRLHICGRTEGLASGWKELGADMIDIDAGNSLSVIRGELGTEGAALAGNLDPVREVRDSNPADIADRVAACMEETGSRYIVGAGCEIPRDCPAVNLDAMRRFAENA